MSDAKKRKKSYYSQAKRQCGGRQMLDVGLKGFLVTCNRMEKQTIREAYNLLNQYSAEMYGEEAAVKRADADDSADVEVDFSEAISSQVAALQGGSSGAVERRFQAVDTKTSNCIFIKTTLDHPDELVTKLLTDALTTGTTKARFILKIFPVLGTCRAVEDKIEKLVEEMVSSYFPDRSLRTFAIVYKVRCNNLSRDIILPIVGKAVYKVCPTAKVDLSDPDYTISVDVLTKFACVSIMKDFNRLKKYNLQELAKAGLCAGTSKTDERDEVEENRAANDEKCSPQEDSSRRETEPAPDTDVQTGSELTSDEVVETTMADGLLSNTNMPTSGDGADCYVDIVPFKQMT